MGGVPAQQKPAQGGGGLRQFFAVGQGGHLLDGGSLAVALGAVALAAAAIVLFEPFGDVLQLADQLPKGHRAL